MLATWLAKVQHTASCKQLRFQPLLVLHMGAGTLRMLSLVLTTAAAAAPSESSVSGV